MRAAGPQSLSDPIIDDTEDNRPQHQTSQHKGGTRSGVLKGVRAENGCLKMQRGGQVEGGCSCR